MKKSGLLEKNVEQMREEFFALQQTILLMQGNRIIDFEFHENEVSEALSSISRPKTQLRSPAPHGNARYSTQQYELDNSDPENF